MSQKKIKTVVVGKYGATVFINHEDPESLITRESVVLCDPDLSHVRGVSPSHWKWDGNKLVEMTDREKEERERINPSSSPDKISIFSNEAIAKLEDNVDCLWDCTNQHGKELLSQGKKLEDFKRAYNVFKGSTYDDVADLFNWQTKIIKWLWSVTFILAAIIIWMLK